MIKGVNSSADVYEKGKLPQTEAEWLELNDVQEGSIDVEGLSINYAVFHPAHAENLQGITIFAGGIPRDSRRRDQLPLVNKLFGFVAAGMTLQSTIGVNFNWPGQGRSDGDILATSIDSRTTLLQMLSERLADKFAVDTINFVAASMGAYCAAMAAKEVSHDRLGKLAFLSPAAYPESAHSLTYNDGFTSEISKPWDTETSPIYTIIKKLEAPVLTAYSEFDNPPIPLKVQQAFKDVALDVPDIEYHIIDGVCHNFRRPGSEQSGNIVDNNAVRNFGKKVVDFLRTE